MLLIQANVLKLRKPQCDKQIKWEDGTIDNEHMNKKKSKSSYLFAYYILLKTIIISFIFIYFQFLL